MSTILGPDGNPADTQGQERKVFKIIDRGNVKELRPIQKTSEYHLKFRPWMVELLIHPAKDPAEVYRTRYFIRCGNPSDAAGAAEKFFQEWEKNVFAPDFDYPDTSGTCGVTVLDESDWFEELANAKRAIVRCFAGDTKYPHAFMYYMEGWPKVWTALVENPGLATEY
jgi:hypothetical protein